MSEFNPLEDILTPFIDDVEKSFERASDKFLSKYAQDFAPVTATLTLSPLYLAT